MTSGSDGATATPATPIWAGMPWLAGCHWGGPSGGARRYSLDGCGQGVGTGVWVSRTVGDGSMGGSVGSQMQPPTRSAISASPISRRHTCRGSRSRLASSIHPLPVENVAAGFLQANRHRSCGADRLVALVQDDHVPGGVGLDDGKIILAAALAGDDRVAVPLIVADQPHASQGMAPGVGDVADDIGRRLRTAGTGMRGIGLGREGW